MMIKKILPVFSLMLFIHFISFAQYKVIKGKVMDAHSEEPLSFCTIYLQGTTNGATADINGNFKITYSEKCDTIVFTSIGYTKVKMAIKHLDDETLNVSMERRATTAKTVTIHLGQDPAVTMFKRIQLHKHKNDKNKLGSYQYEVYNKLELDIDKISDKMRNNKLLKPFAFVYKFMDSTSEEKPFLPMYLTESMSDYYYRKSPRNHKEVIKASKMAGGSSENLSQFLGTMYQDINLYDNRVLLMGVYFISPIANGGLFYYNYKITDTAFIDSRKCFKLSFQPKRTGENTFIGDLWVNDTTWAIKQISMTIADGANINFIKRISVFQNYIPLNDTLWMMNKDKFIVSFIAAGKEKPGVIGRKTTQYRNIKVNQPMIDTAFADHQDLVVLQGATAKPADFWLNNRYDSLSKNERNIYKMVDTIQQVPAFRHYQQAFTTLSTGYYTKGYFSFGPYYNVFAINHVEGSRIGFGIANSELVSKKMWADAQFAYGIGDKKIKYDLSTWYIFKKLPRQELKLRYLNDVVTYNLTDDQLGENNLFSSMVRRVPTYSKLTGNEEVKISYNKEWKSGFGERITIKQSSLHPFFKNDFYTTNGVDLQTDPHYKITEISLRSRFAYHEKFVAGDFLRSSIGSDYPIATLELKQGIKGILNSQFSYSKIRLQIDGEKSTGTIGSFYYSVAAEKVFGNLPMIMLAVMPGNDTYYYNKYSYNNAARYEFVTDQYISASLYEYFGGFPLNYIPLIKKLKWRTFVGGKGFWGNMSEQNKTMNGYYTNKYFNIPNKEPYMELSTGIENIFKVFRLDFIWRLNYLDKTQFPYAQPLGIRGSLQVEF
ncbi:MAG: hypothetical protein RJA07_557 [Bacteroidota bacterium]